MNNRYVIEKVRNSREGCDEAEAERAEGQGQPRRLAHWAFVRFPRALAQRAGAKVRALPLPHHDRGHAEAEAHRGLRQGVRRLASGTFIRRSLLEIHTYIHTYVCTCER